MFAFDPLRTLDDVSTNFAATNRERMRILRSVDVPTLVTGRAYENFDTPIIRKTQDQVANGRKFNGLNQPVRQFIREVVETIDPVIEAKLMIVITIGQQDA